MFLYWEKTTLQKYIKNDENLAEMRKYIFLTYVKNR